jgi:hypothetical protein
VRMLEAIHLVKCAGRYKRNTLRMVDSLTLALSFGVSRRLLRRVARR